MRLMMGDCLERMAEIEDGSVDLVLTDPPYGTTACKWDAVIPFDPMWEQVWKVLKPNGAAVFTASQPFTSSLVMSAAKQFKHEWIWHKNAGSNFATVKWQPMKEHESVLVFAKGTPNYFAIKQPRVRPIKSGYTNRSNTGKRSAYGGMVNEGFTVSDADMRVPSSVQKFNRERGHHPTQKPVALMEYLIRTYTNEGETVLDFTMGSGTTGVACANLNRNFIGIERDPTYFQIAQQRIEEAQRRLL